MFQKYNSFYYNKLRKQHNILVLVGNGFDVSVLKKYNQGRMKGKTTSYKDFYDYITHHNLVDQSNILYKKMTEDRNSHKDNWSDFENSIKELFESGESAVSELEKCVDEFQGFFTRFLNDMVDIDFLLKINEESKKNKFANQSLAHFLEDINSPTFQFPENTDHYDLFDYVFVNFNYTSILDNYMCMDKDQFDPHCYKSIDTNFSFYLNDEFKNKHQTVYSSYVISDIIHPHGVQDVPRSILFGMDIPNYDKGKSEEKKLIKSYWAQYDIKYKSYFDDAELFIIYGMSLGQSDGWWMDKIFDAILDRQAELIIYMFGREKEENVKNRFIQACIRHAGATEEDKDNVKERIFVVTFAKNDTYFLGLEKKDDIK